MEGHCLGPGDLQREAQGSPGSHVPAPPRHSAGQAQGHIREQPQRAGG